MHSMLFILWSHQPAAPSLPSNLVEPDGSEDDDDEEDERADENVPHDAFPGPLLNGKELPQSVDCLGQQTKLRCATTCEDGTTDKSRHMIIEKRRTGSGGNRWSYLKLYA